MSKPIYNGEAVTSENIDHLKADAAAAGLPKIGELQALAMAKKNGVTWLYLEDGSEDIRNEKGEFVEWV